MGIALMKAPEGLSGNGSASTIGAVAVTLMMRVVFGSQILDIAVPAVGDGVGAATARAL